MRDAGRVKIAHPLTEHQRGSCAWPVGHDHYGVCQRSGTIPIQVQLDSSRNGFKPQRDDGKSLTFQAGDDVDQHRDGTRSFQTKFGLKELSCGAAQMRYG